jgi:hypothetical protein
LSALQQTDRLKINQGMGVPPSKSKVDALRALFIGWESGKRSKKALRQRAALRNMVSEGIGKRLAV